MNNVLFNYFFETALPATTVLDFISELLFEKRSCAVSLYFPFIRRCTVAYIYVLCPA